MSASVVSSFIASSEKNGGGIAWAEKPISAVSNFAASSEAIRTLWLQLVEQAVSDGDKMQLIADKPRLLIRLGQVSLIARQVETALTLGKQAAAIAAVQEAKGDEAWARFLVGRAYLAASEPDLDESEKQLDTALRLATACEARPLAAFCNTTLSGIYARRGDQVGAREVDTVATATYRELGMQPLTLDTNF